MQVPSVVKSSLLFLALSGCAFAPAYAQTDQSAGERKIVSKAAPAYPPLARSMNLMGSVKLQVRVLATGSVKDIQIKGGNPVLAQAAQNAVREWKWEKSDHDTVENLDIRFTP
jgi:protein TonB